MNKQKAEIIFERINDNSDLKGKIVAIEPESGDYFIGDSELDAYNKANKTHPNKKFYFKRIGFSATHFVGIKK